MAETTLDIIGKGFKYEERVNVEQIIESFNGSICGFVGVANWGPVNQITKVIKNFEKYFGTEINRDVPTKDYSGIVAKRVLKINPICLFMRITDGTDQKASKLMMKLASGASIAGKEIIQGKTIKINEANNIYKTLINDTEYTVTLPLSPIATPIISNPLPISLTDPAAKNFNVGDYFEIYIDGLPPFQYIISNANDILCRLVGPSRYDDSYYGGVAGNHHINYIDRLIYALKIKIIGNNDPHQIIRKVDNNKISINSLERGASSVIKINSFPIVFPLASSTNPLISTAANTQVTTILDAINNVIGNVGQVYINASRTFETKTITTGASSNIAILPIPQINLENDFNGILISGAGNFNTDPTPYWTALTNGLIANLTFALNNTIFLPAGTQGSDATAATHTGNVDVSNGYDWNANPASFMFAIDNNTPTQIELNQTCNNANEIAAYLNTLLDGVTATNENGYIKLTRNISGANASFTLNAPSSGNNALVTLGMISGIYTGTNATRGYAEMVFPIELIETDKCVLSAGTYIINLTIDGTSQNYSIVVNGNETWGSFVNLINAINGISASIVNENIIRITSNTLGNNSSVVIAEGSNLNTAITLTYNSDEKSISINTSASVQSGHSLAQRFTVTDAYSKQEFWCNVLSGNSNIKAEIYKGSKLLKSIIFNTSGVKREAFYTLTPGNDYKIVFKVINNNIAGNVIINNLYIGPYRTLRNDTLYNFLGIKHSEGAYDLTYDQTLRPQNKIYGEDAVLDMGTFKAKYTGSDGNLLKVIKTTSDNIPTMTVAMGNTILGRITNFSYKVNEPTFFGNLINNDLTISQYLEYILPSTPVTEIANIPDGVYELSGGTSGISGVTDSQYVEALDKFKNMDVYNVDILSVCGNSTKIVFDKIQEVCEYRKDCFGIVDPPEVVAGKPGGIITGGADSMILWHNGKLSNLLNKKLDSKYLVTYFPWVLINADSTINPQQWMPPSVAVIPVIAYIDLTTGNKVTPPAGKRAIINDINDIAYYLTEEEKGRIYDDQIGNNINPIVYTSRFGFFIDGQKTTQRERNAYNRISTMRVSLFMKRKLFEIVPNFYYLPINDNTRKDLVAVIDKDIMQFLVGVNAIKENYEIICDASINTPNIEADNGLVAMIIWQPIKSLEKIKIISYMKDKQVIVQF